jgi:hypothetical protein
MVAESPGLDHFHWSFHNFLQIGEPGLMILICGHLRPNGLLPLLLVFNYQLTKLPSYPISLSLSASSAYSVSKVFALAVAFRLL